MIVISCIIPFRNDFEKVDAVVNNLLATTEENSELEIIVVNDGSFQHNNKFRPLKLDQPNTRVINNPIARGVGYSFDHGVSIANSDIIVLMGCDVFTQKGWYDIVRNEVLHKPDRIGCSVCLGSKSKNFGADLLITVDKEDLPKDSGLHKRPFYTDIFKGRWRLVDTPPKDTCDISCLMGAFYFTSKQYYQFIGGWDTDLNERWQGHRQWGHLEPHISLKSWLVGGGCYLQPSIETTHIFNRKGEHRFAKGSRSLDNMWWNALWILETMVMDAHQREQIYNFLHPELNLNVAQKNIKKNYENVLKIRNRNKSIFKHNLTWFIDKFGCKIK